jgi:hydroxymethylpyrimidine/phosphomethylpyrimidine kinase
LGCANVLFKGGHGPALPNKEGAEVRDVLAGEGGTTSFVSPRQATRHTHGTGCTLSTAIACGLAAGLPLTEAVARAHEFVQQAIRSAPGLGAGQGPLNHRIGSW